MIEILLIVLAWFLIGCVVAWIIGGASGRDSASDK